MWFGSGTALGLAVAGLALIALNPALHLPLPPIFTGHHAPAPNTIEPAGDAPLPPVQLPHYTVSTPAPSPALSGVPASPPVVVDVHPVYVTPPPRKLRRPVVPPAPRPDVTVAPAPVLPAATPTPPPALRHCLVLLPAVCLP